jgi:hypothetical protein
MYVNVPAIPAIPALMSISGAKYKIWFSAAKNNYHVLVSSTDSTKLCMNVIITYSSRFESSTKDHDVAS